MSTEAQRLREMRNESIPNCPFYGCRMYASTAAHPPVLFLLGRSEGSPISRKQCALVTDAEAPCLFQIEREPIEWRGCPRVRDIRVGWRGDEG